MCRRGVFTLMKTPRQIVAGRGPKPLIPLKEEKANPPRSQLFFFQAFKKNMSKHTSTFLSVGIFAFALVMAGCGQQELPTKDTVPVHGRALLHGEPIRYAIIQLDPADSDGMPASGKTDADGYFMLWTYGNEQPDGAVPGRYTVTFDQGGAKPIGGIPTGEPGPTILPDDIGAITLAIGPSGGDVEIIIP
jgi:hypothetical protein